MVTTGLVAYFPLNNTTQESVSGLSVTTATTVTYATTGGKTGLVCTSAVYSASSTNIITNVNIPNLNLVGTGVGYSFSFWLYQNNVTNAQSNAFTFMNASLSGFAAQAYNNTLYFSYNFNGGTTTNCNGPLTNLAWNHVVFVVNSNQTTTLYINNVIPSNNPPTPVGNNTTVYPSSMSIGSGNKFGIGCDNSFSYNLSGWTGAGKVYNGYFSKLGIYNIPLSAAQVTALYNAG